MLLRFNIIQDVDYDINCLFQLKSEPNDIYWSGYSSAPDKKKFIEWFKDQLNRTDRKIWLVHQITEKNSAIGYLYLTFENDIVYLSHGVKEEFAGQGIGSEIINFATNVSLNFFSNYHIEAWIIEHNEASIRTFLKNSFNKTDKEKEIYYQSFGRNVLMFNYRFK